MGTFTALRHTDWSVRWTHFMKESQDIAADLVLDWEYVTCTSWCGQCVEELTGSNPFDLFVDAFGEFKGVVGAVRVIKKAGFNTLDQLIGSLFDGTPVGLAQQGDLVLVRTSQWIDSDSQEGAEEFALEVMPHGLAVADPPFYWAVTEKGLGKGDLYRDGIEAFKVGRV